MVCASGFAYEAQTEIGESDWSPPATVVNSCNTPPLPPDQGVSRGLLSRKYGIHAMSKSLQGLGIIPKILGILARPGRLKAFP
jgi:hypothetical protein